MNTMVCALGVPAAKPRPRETLAPPLSEEIRSCYRQYLPAVLENCVLVLFGGPAAGKGTQADNLSAFWGVPTISMGHLLRKRAEVGDELGRHIEATQKGGGLVENSIVFDLLYRHLRALGNPKAFILDGVPRSEDQVELVDQLLKSLGIQNIVVGYLETTVETALLRAARRREKDIRAGRKPRDDDDPKVVPERVELFKTTTKPIAEIYKRRGQLVRIDADGDDLIDNVRTVALRLGTLLPRDMLRDANLFFEY